MVVVIMLATGAEGSARRETTAFRKSAFSLSGMTRIGVVLSAEKSARVETEAPRILDVSGMSGICYVLILCRSWLGPTRGAKAHESRGGMEAHGVGHCAVAGRDDVL